MQGETDIASIERQLNELMQQVDRLRQRGRQIPKSLKAQVRATLKALEQAENAA